MRLQRYFPSRAAEQVLWLGNFRLKLPVYGTALALSEDEVAAAVADAAWLVYVLGTWETEVRIFPKAGTAAIDALLHGDGPSALPTFTPPAVPEGVAPVPNGALDRIFALVARIKVAVGCTPAIARDLGLVPSDPNPARTAPRFSLDIEHGSGGQKVSIRFFKYGHQAVWIESRRADGDAEVLPLGGGSSALDARPLLIPGQPEVRAYRLRFWDKGEPTGEWTAWREITVAP